MPSSHPEPSHAGHARLNSTDQVAHDLYVVRDSNGLYMGLFTFELAQERWPQSVLQNSIITLGQTEQFATAADSADQELTASTIKSNRLLHSLRIAKQFNKSHSTRESSKFWKRRAHITYYVFHNSDNPICKVPYACLTHGFGNRWIVFSDDSVQLVGDWSPNQISTGIDLARSFAKEAYEKMAPPGSMSTVAKHATLRQMPIQPLTQPLAERLQIRNGQIESQHVTRHVVRDENGCILGVYAPDEATKLWADARLDSSVIVVPRTIEFDEASRTIKGSKGFGTSFTANQYKAAIHSACLLPPKLAGRDATQFWRANASTKLNVFNDTSEPIGRLTPAELTETFGTQWFLLSITSAQVMANLASGVVKVRVRVMERRPAKTVSAAQAKPAVNPPQGQSKQSTKKQKLNPNMFYVIGCDEKIVYQCQKKKCQPVEAYLIRLLPSDSYKQTSTGIMLTWSLKRLGFKNSQVFSQACAAACKGNLHGPSTEISLPKAKPTSKPPSSSRQNSENGRTIVSKGTKSSAKEVISFDGPEHVLYVSKGAMSCERKGHRVEGATGAIVTLAGRLVAINVNYCNNCHRYYIGQREYEHYRDIYGPILGNFSFPTNMQGKNGSLSLSKESPLMMCGYTVRESDGLTSKERQLILANIIDRKILSKPRVIDYLQFFVSWRDGNPNMRNACDKWREDLTFVRNYKMDTQRRFSIRSVQRYR
jgi:hypothetical protein